MITSVKPVSLCILFILITTAIVIPIAIYFCLKNYPVPPPTSMCGGGAVRKDNWKLPGNDIPGFPVNTSDYASCCLKCQTTGGCVAFSYRNSTQDCWAKTSMGNNGSSDADTISGYNPNMCNGFVSKDNWNLPGNDIPGFPVKEPDYASCCLKCQAIAGCVAFSYTKPNQNCWPKTSMGNDGSSDAYTISGYEY